MGIVVYTTNNCMQCKATKRFLDSKNVEYETVNISGNQEIRELLKEHGFSAAPVTVVDGDFDHAIKGFAVDQLKKIV